ncbi:MAG: membrane protein insertase YidC [Acidobacteria bacterium]|nr:membrane protein insertase YidC [Acidobacteriota bacterium]
MEKRVFLAFVLSFIVLAVYQSVFAPNPPARPAQAPASAASAPSTPSAASATTGQPAETAPASNAPATTGESATPLVADARARDIIVETDLVRAVFSTAGATLRSWTLKRYLEGGQPLEFVPKDLPATYPKPFTLSTDDPAISSTLATALFRPSSDALTLGASPGTLSFEYRDASGRLNARKTFHFQPDGKPYIVRVEASIDVGGTSKPVTLAWGPAVGLGYSPDGSRSAPVRGVQVVGGDVEFLSASSLQQQGRYEGNLRFAGVEDHYFLCAVVPGTERVAVQYTPVTLPVPGDSSRNRELIAYEVTVPGALAVPFFMGPKDFDILRAVDGQLVKAIDFGMFDFLVVPLLLALKWVNGYIGNYGWSIVALTVLINLVIFPLRHRSMVSMKKMQALQPEMKAIQDRYAKYKMTDPERQKMNQEVMALYRQRGVNPASGCLPMLLTLPVLFAFYAMLSAAIELRGAPFFGWIHDLARHDPLYVTPLLMGLTQFWQMRMTPSTADPIQQKMFMMLPVVFTVSFLWAPAGLVVYWFVSNLLAIGQQYVTNRIIGQPVRPPKPRSAGAGSRS